MTVRRRDFLVNAFTGLAGLATFGRNAIAANEARSLSFYHLHTDETLSVVYSEHGARCPARSRKSITSCATSAREQTPHRRPPARRVVGALRRFERRGNFEVISGYRSPQTNAALRHASAGVAKNSLHLRAGDRRAAHERRHRQAAGRRDRDASAASATTRVQFRAYRYRRLPDLVVAARPDRKLPAPRGVRCDLWLMKRIAIVAAIVLVVAARPRWGYRGRSPWTSPSSRWIAARSPRPSRTPAPARSTRAGARVFRPRSAAKSRACRSRTATRRSRRRSCSSSGTRTSKPSSSFAARRSSLALARARSLCDVADVAKRDAERSTKLREQRLASEEAADQAEGKAESRRPLRGGEDAARVADARVEVARAHLERTQLCAPFDGVIAEINGELGEFVTPSPVGIPTPPTVDSDRRLLPLRQRADRRGRRAARRRRAAGADQPGRLSRSRVSRPRPPRSAVRARSGEAGPHCRDRGGIRRPAESRAACRLQRRCRGGARSARGRVADPDVGDPSRRHRARVRRGNADARGAKDRARRRATGSTPRWPRV